MSGSFVGQVPRRRGWYRIGIGLAGVCLGAFPVLGVTGQGSGAAILPLAENCNPPTITSAGSVTATAGASFNFTVTTCTTAIPTFKSVHLPSGLTLMSNGDGTATISGKPGVHDTGIYNATIIAEVAGQTSAVQALAISVDNTPAFTTSPFIAPMPEPHSPIALPPGTGYPIPSIATGSTLRPVSCSPTITTEPPRLVETRAPLLAEHTRLRSRPTPVCRLASRTSR